MKIDDLCLVADKAHVIFSSSSANEHRRSLNGRLCWIYGDDDYPDGWKKVPPEFGYAANIAVCLQFLDTYQKTWASIDEFEPVMYLPRQPIDIPDP